MKPFEIVMNMEGGVIHEVSRVPAGILIVTRDYDVEGVDPEEYEIKKNAQGNEYWERRFEGGKHGPIPSMVELLNDAIDEWKEFDGDESVAATDLLDWFAGWRERVKLVMAEVNV